MIVFRYLSKEVLSNMFAVSLVLLLIIISARFVGYLAEAAAGKLDAGVLLTLMAYRLPAYLELILPLGLFIGILLAYGRMYVDSEMTVLSACGMSELRLVSFTLISSSVVALLVAFFSLYLGPEGVRASEALLAEQRSRTDFETLMPARFHELDSGRGVSYAKSMSDDKQQLNHVFIAELPNANSNTNPTILIAESGQTVVNEQFGQKFLLLKNGRRYVGRPGDANYEIVQFDEYSQLLPEPDYAIASKKATDGLTTKMLLTQESLQASAALQWRFSLPLLVMILGFMAVPLSRTEPRKGRYGKILPAILLYVLYLVVANSARGLIEEGKAPLPGFLWFVHLSFLALSLFIYNAKGLIGSIKQLFTTTKDTVEA